MKKYILDVLGVEPDYTYRPPDDLKRAKVVSIVGPNAKLKTSKGKIIKMIVTRMKFNAKPGTSVAYSLKTGHIYKPGFIDMAEPVISFDAHEDAVLKTATVLMQIRKDKGELKDASKEDSTAKEE